MIDGEVGMLPLLKGAEVLERGNLSRVALPVIMQSSPADLLILR
jgi:hypothetical protein